MLFVPEAILGNFIFIITISITMFGVLGMITAYQNILITLLCIELLYLGAISTFGVIAVLHKLAAAFLYSLLLLVLAAGESAVGLGILLILHRCGRGLS
jgi:NADH:ubiquinone oxidoreductase subunit K